MEKYETFAVITGASSGIGREFSFRLAREGYSLVLVARNVDKLDRLADELSLITAKKAEIIIVEADLSTMEDCLMLYEELAEREISVFVNNAGFGDCSSFLEGDINKELSMIDVNVKAVHLLTKLTLLKMKEQGYGELLNVASSAGLIPAGPYMATYYATKAYVASLTRAIAQELREANSPIYIGCLCPGPVDTGFNDVAGVKFSLKGITAEYCANYAVDQMHKKKVVIVPTVTMKLATFFGRFLPQKTYIGLTGKQQKKKFMDEKQGGK